MARLTPRFISRFLPRLPPSSWLLEIFNLDSYLSRCGKVHIKIHAMLALLILTTVICKKLTRLGKILGKIQTKLNLLGPLLRLCLGSEISTLPWRQGYCAVRSNQTILNITTLQHGPSCTLGFDVPHHKDIIMYSNSRKGDTENGMAQEFSQ